MCHLYNYHADSFYLLPHKSAVELIWGSFEHTVVVESETYMLFVYGVNRKTSKYIGYHQEKTKFFNQIGAFKRYCLPKKNCTYVIYKGGKIVHRSKGWTPIKSMYGWRPSESM